MLKATLCVISLLVSSFGLFAQESPDMFAAVNATNSAVSESAPSGVAFAAAVPNGGMTMDLRVLGYGKCSDAVAQITVQVSAYDSISGQWVGQFPSEWGGGALVTQPISVGGSAVKMTLQRQGLHKLSIGPIYVQGCNVPVGGKQIYYFFAGGASAPNDSSSVPAGELATMMSLMPGFGEYLSLGPQQVLSVGLTGIGAPSGSRYTYVLYQENESGRSVSEGAIAQPKTATCEAVTVTVPFRSVRYYRTTNALVIDNRTGESFAQPVALPFGRPSSIACRQ